MPSEGKKKRKARQSKRKLYQKIREDLQTSGEIPVTPEGALRPEVVDPATQDSQRFPGLDRLAIRSEGKGWAVPEAVKRKVVEVNAEVLFETKTMTRTIEGVEVTVELPPDRQAQAAASKVLMEADKRQWERDHPAEAGQAAGASQVNVLNGEFWDGLVQQVEAASEDSVEQKLEAAKVVASQPTPKTSTPPQSQNGMNGKHHQNGEE